LCYLKSKALAEIRPSTSTVVTTGGTVMTETDDSTSAERMLKIGIYRIVNLETGKIYIGSTTTSFKRRWEQHLQQLEKGTHVARHLQNSWNKRGPAAFVFEILEEIDDPEQVIERE
jgi:predicted GIY-YIG superfamily endonuclease